MIYIKDTRNFQKIEKDFVKKQGLPFEKALSEKELRRAIEKQGLKFRNRIFTPVITIWAFLSQILEKGSCREATKRIQSFWVSKDPQAKKLSKNSGYCEARKRLPEKLLKTLVTDVGCKISNLAKAEHLWCGRRVKVIDGTGLTVDDTEKNRTKYDQGPNQKPGCGFPMVKVTAMFCLATGAVLRATISHFNTSEYRLFPKLYQHLSPSDVVLGDRGCFSYVQLCKVLAKTSDFVFRFPTGKKIKLCNEMRVHKNDHLVTWVKPRRYGGCILNKIEYALLPSSLTLRMVTFRVDVPGYRTEHITIMTSLLDFKMYSQQQIASLFMRRWQVEINIRHLKTMMEMEHISSKTPDMVRKQFWAYLLAYNLIRRIMLETGLLHNVDPLRVSFKGTIDSIRAYASDMSHASSEQSLKALFDMFYWDLATDLIPLRPFRVHPRALKRRKKDFPCLTEARSLYQSRVFWKSTGALCASYLLMFGLI